MSTKLDRDWQEFYQGGFYAQGWAFNIEQQQTQNEVESVLGLLGPEPGAHILDWCGGWGRHSVEFAKRGFKVTLLDFAENHIEMAEKFAQEAGVELNLIHADFRETPVSIQADYAVNMFTAGLGHYTIDDDIKALVSLCGALKHGAKFLIDTMNVYWLALNYQPRGWRESEDGKIRHFSKREFNFLTNRNISEEILWVEGESERRQSLDHHIFSPSELEAVLSQAGFASLELFGDFDGQDFAFDSRRIVMISEKQ